MGVVVSEIDVSANPLVAFEVAQDVDKYPDFMPDVKGINVIERRPDGFARVAWSARAKVASIDKEINWIEDEWWNSKTLTCKFVLVDGDYKHYSGDWAFIPIECGTRIRLSIDYDLGLPLIGPIIHKLLDRIMQNNLDGMLKAIKVKSESAGAAC